MYSCGLEFIKVTVYRTLPDFPGLIDEWEAFKGKRNRIEILFDIVNGTAQLRCAEINSWLRSNQVQQYLNIALRNILSYKHIVKRLEDGRYII